MKQPLLLCLLILCFFSCTNFEDKRLKKVEHHQLNKAYDYLDLGKSDSAFYYFNEAKAEFILKKDHLMIGNCLLNMAIISTDQGDYFGAQEIALDALQYFDKNDKNHFQYLQSSYNTLGITASKLKNYRQAINFYTEALNYADGSAHHSTIQNNIGNAYIELKNYAKSLEIFKKILNEQPKNTKVFAMALTNISKAKWLQNAGYNASPALLKAMQIRKKIGNNWGLNSSYTHLANYYSQNKIDSALFYANKRYETAQLINSPDDQLEALKKLIALAPEKNGKRYFTTLQQLNDSLQTARSNAKNQFALIRYETEKHKADNLLLQKQNTERKYQIITLLAAAILTSIIGLLWYRKRKHALKLENERNIKENQLKTSKKVHDVVANGLYRVMSEIENKEALNKELLLDQIEELYEKSRDISYEEIAQTINFQERITNLLTAFASDRTKVILINNTESIWLSIAEKTKHELEQILQELMVNMKKHSHATNVVIKFGQTDIETSIYYADNGIGLNKEAKFKNGLTNTGNRIKNISGKITFDSGLEQGLKIQISFPTT